MLLTLASASLTFCADADLFGGIPGGVEGLAELRDRPFYEEIVPFNLIPTQRVAATDSGQWINMGEIF